MQIFDVMSHTVSKNGILTDEYSWESFHTMTSLHRYNSSDPQNMSILYLCIWYTRLLNTSVQIVNLGTDRISRGNCNHYIFLCDDNILTAMVLVCINYISVIDFTTHI